jgi:hypothetical protein
VYGSLDSSSCTLCPSGTYSTVGMTSCITCPTFTNDSPL